MAYDYRILACTTDAITGADVQHGFNEYVQSHALPWHIVVIDSRTWRVTRDQIDNIGMKMDAMVGMVRSYDPFYSWAQRDGMAIASCSQNPPPQTRVHVRIDEEAVARTALQHVLEQGYSTVAWVENADKGFGSMYRRLQAMKELCGDMGVRHVQFPIKPSEREDKEADLGEWLQRQEPGTAVFCHNDLSAAWLSRLCELRQICVPDHIGIIGVDNNCHVCEQYEPGLSSVIVPWRHIGRTLGIGLHRLLNGQADGALAHVCQPRAVQGRESTALRARLDPLMDKAQQLLSRSGKHANVQEVARRMGMSRRSLQDRFQHCFGCSPKQWQLRVRLQRARELLLLTNDSVAEIARTVGFGDYRQFSKTFRQRTGLSPLAFRREGQVRAELPMV